MKAILNLIISSLLAVSAFAGSITLRFNSDNFQAVVDGKTYTATDYNSSTRRNEIIIPNLQPGKHTIQIFRLNNNRANQSAREVFSLDFGLDTDRDIQITVNANGAVSMVESESSAAYGEYNNSAPYRSAMSEANFNQLYSTINNQWSQSNKLTALRNAFNTTANYFSTYQARQLISLISTEANRLELAKLSYDNIADPSNFRQLYDVFSRQASRDELDNYVRNNSYNSGNTGGPSYNNTYHSPMSDASFNTLYQNIRKQWLPGAKMSAATDAFNSTTNYFTTSQVRQIILLVSSEDNRLQLAKLAFDNVTDPSGFRQLYDVFSSQASKDELDNYLRTNYNYQY